MENQTSYNNEVKRLANHLEQIFFENGERVYRAYISVLKSDKHIPAKLNVTHEALQQAIQLSQNAISPK